MKIIVQDNLFQEEERLNIYNDANNNNKSFNSFWIPKDKLPSGYLPLVNFASEQFDLSECNGYECWTHYNTKPEWHYDKDELLFQTKNILSFPICSIVYYPLIENLTGGHFVTEDASIKPKTNRAITFSPGIFHSVEAYKGMRFSLLLNPWKEKPLGL